MIQKGDKQILPAVSEFDDRIESEYISGSELNRKKFQYLKKTKAFEIVYRLYKTEQAQEHIRAIRVQIDIPTSGFANLQDRIKFDLDGYSTEREEYIDEQVAILACGYLTTHSHILLREFIICGEHYDTFADGVLTTDLVCGVDYLTEAEEMPTFIDKEWHNAKVPYIKMYISSYASQKEVEDFIRRYWQIIKKVQRQQGDDGTKQRVRVTPDKELNDLIYNLYYKNDKKELEQELGRAKPTYKAILIQQYLQENLGRKMSDKTIKKIAEREKERRKTT